MNPRFDKVKLLDTFEVKDSNDHCHVTDFDFADIWLYCKYLGKWPKVGRNMFFLPSTCIALTSRSDWKNE